MEPIRTIVVDDEPNAREGILGLLGGHDDMIVVGEAQNGREAVSLIGRERPELVYLDIQMPELDGFGVLAELPPADLPIVVFVTAYDAHALRAFEVHALDYLLKPFSDERFGESLTLAKHRVRQRRAGALSQELAALLEGTGAPAPESRDLPSVKADEPGSTSAVGEPYLDRLMVPTARGTVFIRADQIDWIEADDYYAKLHVGGRAYLLRETMQSLASRLDPKRFVRTHRSAIVNIDRIATLQPYFRGAHVLTLKDGTQVTLSRSRRPEFERAIGGRL